MKSTGNIVFRKEQLTAIENTCDCFKSNRKMLWNAKMRFGKTLCAIEVARRCEFRRIIILTHRPAVRSEWFEAIHKLNLNNWMLGCKKRLCPNDSENVFHSLRDMEEKAPSNKSTPIVYFASMQDLRGSRRVNQAKGFDKNDSIFSTNWDLLIVDEAHEGIFSHLGQEVISYLQKKRTLRTLYLSGTPYNIQRMFDKTEVFQWDYSMEQKAKNEWYAKQPDKPNPYSNLARMNIVTYNTSREMNKFTTAGELDFGELFRTEMRQNDSRKNMPHFVHEADVRNFLLFISKNSKNAQAPYAKVDLRGSMNHTMWYVPGVSSALCLSELLQEKSEDNPFLDYTIVNVAGEGDTQNRFDSYEQARFEKNALERVREAICHNPKTITLSCGRLTMGVSVPEWTAVFMLAGSTNTGGMRYFQTIFRCQSPYKNGMTKTECYALDFSPTRTLTMVDQYISNNAVSVNSDERRLKLAEFLHFCPVIEIRSSKEIRYDEESFVRKINQAYSDTLIRNGFRADCLYENLDNLRQQDLRLLDKVADAILRGIASERMKNRARLDLKGRRKTSGKQDISADGNIQQRLSEKENEEIEKVNRTLARLTPRQRAIAILQQISTRFPMMIFGMVENVDGLTLDSFIHSIDKDSWNEFMPKGVTMKMFERIKHFYREDIFIATAKAIVERLKRADNLPVAERIAEVSDIISDFCYPDRETILTPWRTVNRHMADTIGGYCFYDKDFETICAEPRFIHNGEITERTLMNPNVRFLDIASKTGLYSLYAAYSMYKLRSRQSQGLFDLLTEAEAEALWEDIVTKNIFAICHTRMAESITRRAIMGYRDISKVNICRIEDLNAQIMVYKKKFVRIISNSKNYSAANNGMELRFDAIIGNPPYQINIGEKKENYGIPLYNHFVETAIDMKPNYVSMIMPSRWFTGGRGLDGFRRAMLSDNHLRSIHDFVDSKECFPTVDISGGVNYFLWDLHHKGKCEFTNTLNGKTNTCARVLNEHPIFVRNNKALTLIDKVCHNANGTLSSMVVGQTPFGFVTTFRGNANPATEKDVVLLKSSGEDSYVMRSEIRKNAAWANLYKVIFSKATCEHAGTPDKSGKFRILSSLDIIPPGCICTQSYLVGGVFEKASDAKNYMAYLRTKFVRYLMLQTITSQDLSPDKFMFVPMQDFSSNSDICWSDTIDDIDKQLYAKYRISAEEIDAIEKTIKPM